MKHGACLVAVTLPILALNLLQAVAAPSTLLIQNTSFYVERCCVTIFGEVHNAGSTDSYRTRVSVILYDRYGYALFHTSTYTWDPFIQAGATGNFIIFVADARIAQQTWDYQLTVSSG